MKKNILKFIVFTLITSNLFSLPFNSNLSGDDIEKIKAGEVLINNIDNYRSISLSSENPAAKKLIESVKKTNPNYLAEVIQIRPYKNNENLQQVIRDALENISDYAGIPYWSERHNRYYDLYSSAVTIRTDHVSDELTKIQAELYMEPFGTIYSPIEIEQTSDYLFYQSTNTNDLKFEGITCVRKYNMKSVIILIRDGDNWILYGVGGVKAPRIPFLTHRIEVSFINRIKTFCNYIFEKI